MSCIVSPSPKKTFPQGNTPQTQGTNPSGLGQTTLSKATLPQTPPRSPRALPRNAQNTRRAQQANTNQTKGQARYREFLTALQAKKKEDDLGIFLAAQGIPEGTTELTKQQLLDLQAALKENDQEHQDFLLALRLQAQEFKEALADETDCETNAQEIYARSLEIVRAQEKENQEALPVSLICFATRALTSKQDASEKNKLSQMAFGLFSNQQVDTHPTVDQRDLFNSGRSVTSDEVCAYTEKYLRPGKGVFIPPYPVCNFSDPQNTKKTFQGLSTAANNGKTAISFVNCGESHWISCVMQKHEGVVHVTLLDTAPLQAGYASQVEKELQKQIPDCQIHKIEDSLQENTPNGCGPLSAAFLRKITDRVTETMGSASNSPPPLAWEVASDYVGWWKALSSSQQIRVMEGWRADLLDKERSNPEQAISPTP